MESGWQRWAIVFRALANVNRLKIVKVLWDEGELHVSDITRNLKISLKATSNHLAMLKNLDVIEARGAQGHVFYSLNDKLPADFRHSTDLFLRQ